MKTVIKSDIIDALKEIGLQRGDSVMVHTSLSRIGYVCGGAQAVIEALIEVVGDEGTIMMPTQSWKNLDPETGVHWDVDKSDWDVIRENWPAYETLFVDGEDFVDIGKAFEAEHSVNIAKLGEAE